MSTGLRTRSIIALTRTMLRLFPGTQPLVPDITIHPVSITYSGIYRDTATELGFYGTYHQNIFPGGNDGAGSDFRGPSRDFPNGARFDAKAGYGIVRFGANLSRLIFGEWQIRAGFAAQLTDAALIAGEQFGLGGAESVRGFDERQFSSDRGHRSSVELYTPDVAGKLGWTGGRMRLLTFYDTGTVSRNIPQPGEQDGLSLDSIGLGLRVQAGKNASAKLDFARVLHDGGITAGKPDGRRGSSTLHGSLLLVF